MLYRIHDKLHFGDGTVLEKGDISSLEGVRPGVIQSLLDLERISEASTPPLEILPGWENLAQELEAYDIYNVADLLLADPEVLAAGLSVPLEDVMADVEEARKFIHAS